MVEKKRAEIVLINPPSPFLLDEKLMPPLGLLYIASALRKEGVKLSFLDLAGYPHRMIPPAKYYGITATTPQYPFAKEILNKIKGKVVIGGPHATLAPQECLNDGFDAAIVGEGEQAIFKFLQGQSGKIEESFVKNIDGITFPDRSLIKDYHYQIDGVPATTIVTSRGCYYRKCAFCSQNWPHIRFRSQENVREELEEIRNLGYKAVLIYDDEFFFNRKRDLKIAFDLKELGLIWRCFSRADLIDDEVALIASQMGCKEMLIGFESGSPQILKNIKKGTTVDQNVEAINLLHKHNIRVKAALIIMLPGESVETLTETWNFCEKVESKISEWDFTLCTPYPGSDIYNNPDQYDFGFDKDVIYSAYKGTGSSNWKPPKIWTSNLTHKAGLEFRNKFESRFKFHKKDVKLC